MSTHPLRVGGDRLSRRDNGCATQPWLLTRSMLHVNVTIDIVFVVLTPFFGKRIAMGEGWSCCRSWRSD